MQPDIVSVILRSASFVALFQAAGIALFLAFFGRRIDVSRALIGRIAKLSALAAAVLLTGHYAVEAARMADDMSGVVDPQLQGMVLHSAGSIVLAVRLVGLIVIATTFSGRTSRPSAWSMFGVGLVGISFTLTGHTAAHPLHWGLAPLLTAHVLIVAFWFGSLVPLYLVCLREAPSVAGDVTGAFSKIALWLVPCLFFAGVLLAVALIRHLSEFRSGYGLSVLAKITGFSVLMGLAALNKWTYGPALREGNPSSARAFRRSLSIEYAVICVVLSVTAAMTTFFSPQP